MLFWNFLKIEIDLVTRSKSKIWNLDRVGFKNYGEMIFLLIYQEWLLNLD
jgi:hypothetical protein